MAPLLDGFVKSWPRHLLRVEGLCILGSSIWAYRRFTSQSWYLFAFGILAPDLAMAGYLRDTVLGAAVYNSAHTETPALLLGVAGVVLEKPIVLGTALIWLAHVGMDRMFGFGLKYGSAFGHTHLGDFTARSEKGKTS